MLFLTDEEQDVARDIKNTVIDSARIFRVLHRSFTERSIRRRNINMENMILIMTSM